jgi:hypothetical protein
VKGGMRSCLPPGEQCAMPGTDDTVSQQRVTADDAVSQQQLNMHLQTALSAVVACCGCLLSIMIVLSLGR